MFQFGVKKFLWLKKVKNTVPWTYVISDLRNCYITDMKVILQIVAALYQKVLEEKSKRVYNWKRNKEKMW